MTEYAKNTSVSSEKSKAEIERTLRRYGADQFLSGWEANRAMVSFRMHGKHVRFVLTLPDMDSPIFKRTPAGKSARAPEAQQKAWEQACRQKWRALALVVKAKLEAVESKITTFEEEFLAHILLPDGKTIGEFMVPQIKEVYKHGNMPVLLPMLGEGKKS